MMIYTYEKSGRGQKCAELLGECDELRKFDTVSVLPIPTTKDGRTLSGTDILLADLARNLGPGSLAVGYGIPESLKRELLERGAVVLDALYDEEFLCDNGYLTALATVGIIITTCASALCDLSVGVVGYGRIGSRLTEMLLFLGARVKVFTSKRDTRMLLGASGISSEESREGVDLSGLDILINTAPAVIFDGTAQTPIPEKLRVIDLASGENFPGLARVERYPSVPAKMFPQSAGAIWFKSIKRQLTGIEGEK